ncbi:MAG: AAA family ATPase [Myxococcales bacterium]|nr:AAA family ATPase [Myxococcales bacterium]
MIETLRIEGFRAFEELEVTGLGRVNLIVGRNAVGKTSVLEAISVVAEGMKAPQRAQSLLTERREYREARSPQEVPLLDWSRLFCRRASEETDCRVSLTGDTRHSLRLWMDSGAKLRSDRSRPGWDPYLFQLHEPEHVLSVECSGDDPNDGDRPLFEHRWLPPRGLDLTTMADMFDRLMLSESSDALLGTLRLVVEDIERIAFLSPGGSKGEGMRQPFVRRRGRNTSEPLHSLGDGAVRLLNVALALLDAKGGVLLADEIENGLHYSVQPDLWRLVFRLAAEHDVQVFAATHSWDCIEAFQQAAAEHPATGALVRIERDARGHYATTYSEDELAAATKHSIEVR